MPIKKQNNKERYYQLLLMVTTFAVLALMVQNHLLNQSLNEKIETESGTTVRSPVVTTTTTANLNPILEKLKEFPEMEPYLKYPATVNFLTQKQLDELSKKQPVLYSGLKAPLYKIEFVKEDGTTLLVLYDSEKNQIVKNFEITSMMLGT